MELSGWWQSSRLWLWCEVAWQSWPCCRALLAAGCLVELAGWLLASGCWLACPGGWLAGCLLAGWALGGWMVKLTGYGWLVLLMR
jgi:hypothetical protein